MKGKFRQIYLPTPDELRARCRAIQNEWTPSERNKRTVQRKRGWTPPMVRMTELGFARDNISSST